jgi:hypothetical protein
VNLSPPVRPQQARMRTLEPLAAESSRGSAL